MSVSKLRWILALRVTLAFHHMAFSMGVSTGESVGVPRVDGALAYKMHCAREVNAVCI